MRVAVIGTGYVGLVAGAGFAETGNDVICVDIDEERIKNLLKGIIPIYELGLEDLVKRNVEQGRLDFTTDTAAAVRQSKVIFMAVPTPSDEDGSADLQYLLKAIEDVAKGMNDYKVIVNKSTVPVGTAALVRERLAELTDQSFDVVSNPEFLKEGNAVEDFLRPDRVVVGCSSEEAENIMTDLYGPFVRQGHPIIIMKTESAELTKYSANSFLATKISFINEIAQLCELVGADINEVRSGIGSDTRIGPAFLFPSIGFGGSCFPKDLRALNQTAQSHGREMLVIQAAIQANENQKQFLPDKILDRFMGRLQGRTFAIWGLAFKANTDDIRESPALTIIDMLIEAKASVRVYDPEAMDNTRFIYAEQLHYARDGYDAVEGAEALIVATEWNQFRRPDFERIMKAMKTLVVFDGRNLFDPHKLREMGFEYFGVGRST